jgi:hypothetical protein
MCAPSIVFIKHLATGYQLEKKNPKGKNICFDRSYAILSILRRPVSDGHDKKMLTLSEEQLIIKLNDEPITLKEFGIVQTLIAPESLSLWNHCKPCILQNQSPQAVKDKTYTIRMQKAFASLRVRQY